MNCSVASCLFVIVWRYFPAGHFVLVACCITLPVMLSLMLERFFSLVKYVAWACSTLLLMSLTPASIYVRSSQVVSRTPSSCFSVDLYWRLAGERFLVSHVSQLYVRDVFSALRHTLCFMWNGASLFFV